MLPLVSAIIPAYNAEKTIEDCIKSIVNQTYNNIEIIVVNDGSKDNTLNILNKLSSKIKNLWIYTIPNSGPSNARNWGINHANGEYIAFLDADDKWLPHKIETQITYLKQNSSIDLLACKVSIGKFKGEKENTSIIEISPLKMLFKNYFLTPCIIAKRNILKTYQFNINQKYAEDYLLWLTIAFSNHKCYMINKTLVELANKHTFGDSGLSGKIWEMEKGELFNYKQLLKEQKISFLLYASACIFSFIKYVRRSIICKYRNIKKKI